MGNKPIYGCMYSVIRFVADDIRDEAINIGVVLEVHPNNRLFSFTPDFSRVWRMFPREALNDLPSHVSILKTHFEDRNLKLDDIVTRYSRGKIQLTKPRTVLTSDLNSEIIELRQLLVSEN